MFTKSNTSFIGKLCIVSLCMLGLQACGSSDINADANQQQANQQQSNKGQANKQGNQGEHPRLLLTADDSQMLKQEYKKSPTFARAVSQTEKKVNAYFASAPDVPVPADGGGGYTHEQHKSNAKMLNAAGTLYQVTGDKKYAEYARNMFMRYAGLYPTLGLHPKKKEQTPGKLFWQSLNEAWWLVYSIQAYDAIYDSLSDKEKEHIENNLLRPVANYLSEGQPQTFNKIHNHGTWAVAAVGMTGYVLDDKEYVEKALLGLDKSGEGGFLKQLDILFSPEGYYSEGPYYHRYALMPFVVFGKVIQENEPERKIFEYRNGVLEKAIYTVIQLSYANYFFPLNDAIKDKGLDTAELTFATAIAYGMNGDTDLLSIAQLHDEVILTGDGLKLAQGLDANKATPFPYASLNLGDGSSGDEGALVILRSGSAVDDQAVVFKATKQGMGHGHFDKLHWQFYDNGHEIVSDYGAARFLNVVEKNGGHYLPENNSWAKQTVAHNTLVVDEESHFDNDLSVAKSKYPELKFFESSKQAEIASATMPDAYDDVAFDRTIAIIRSEAFSAPIVLDILKAQSDSAHQYDLPLHYKGHLTFVNQKIDAQTQSMSALGKKNGYQHLWKRAQADIQPGLFQATWLNDNRFYTYTSLVDKPTQAIFTETGANDPDFNLIKETGLILRAQNVDNHAFINVLEAHGEYNGSKEFTKQSSSLIKDIERFSHDSKDLIQITTKQDQEVLIALSYDADATKSHSIEHNGKEIKWSGFYTIL